jgi:molecular chaperone DnaJ
VELPTVDGDTVKQTIPEGTQHQTVFRIKNKGVPFVNGRGRGDMYVRVTVEVPKNLSRKQKDLLDQLEELSSDKNYDAVRKFKEKVEKTK